MIKLKYFAKAIENENICSVYVHSKKNPQYRAFTIEEIKNGECDCADKYIDYFRIAPVITYYDMVIINIYARLVDDPNRNRGETNEKMHGKGERINGM